MEQKPNTPESPAAPQAQAVVGLSDSAAVRIAALKQKNNQPDARLRITVTGGGCSGFQYQMELDDSLQDDDHVFDHDDAAVVIDDISLEYMAGAVVDYVETLGSAAFEIKNPNTTASCGCGNSFAV